MIKSWHSPSETNTGFERGEERRDVGGVTRRPGKCRDLPRSLPAPFLEAVAAFHFRCARDEIPTKLCTYRLFLFLENCYDVRQRKPHCPFKKEKEKKGVDFLPTV